MKLLALFKLPSALAATSTKTVVTAALLAGVTSAATATVVVIGTNAISPTPHAASGQPNDGFILGAKPGVTPLIVVPKSSSSASSKPSHSASHSPAPSATQAPSATSTPSTEPPHVVVIDNPGPTTTPAETSQSASDSSSPSPSPSPSHSQPPPSHSPTPSPSPKPTPTPTKPSCGTFTSAEISWAAHEIGISESALKSAIKAHPAAICCLPKSGANCRPGDQADLVKLAKQVEALEHKAKDSDKGDGKTSGSSGNSSSGNSSADHNGSGDSSGDSSGGQGADNHGADKQGKGHDKSGCWHAR